MADELGCRGEAPAPGGSPDGADPKRRPAPSPLAQLALIATVQILAMATWFSASAVVPALRTSWGISDAQAIWLTGSVQLGFVGGAIASAALNLPDRFPPQRVMACSAVGAGLATAALPFLAESFAAVIVLRLATGLFLAGVYPVGMALMASWFAPAHRGLAIGVLIGALTLGSALPHLLTGLEELPWQGVLLSASALAAVAAALAFLCVRRGPQLGGRGGTHRPRYALEMFRERGPRLANLGYFGHMWELYALWTWLPAFLLAAHPSAPIGLISFLTIGGAGVIGCLLGGWASGRFGRARAAGLAMIVSGACCLASPLVFVAPWPLALIMLAVWGAAVIADSGVFSTALSEVVDHRYTGTALTAQTAIGFLLTLVTINLVPVLARLLGWQFAFIVLALGPLLGAVAMRSFGRLVRGTPSPR
ncbi:MFS transporter [Brevibacterium sp.]|uniref:MFS transporter n=1 Tax=Brevibacterium sp. TaxID=1701 RepID=UPI002810BC10|nr:MFS transporter [Brevibacterium sp.]